jgi:flavin-dependent dehydrogenase
MQFKIRNPKSEILIVGAGPAGAGAAIRLAQQGFSVTLVEREKFPRQKLCGEFISPECFAHFRELGVLDEMLSGGGDRITETVFYAPNGKRVSVPSKWFNREETALGLSRAQMDFRLMERAKDIGIDVLEDTAAVGLLIEDERICGIKVKDKDGYSGEIAADLTIDATGRANVLGKLAVKDIYRRDADRTHGRQNDKQQRAKVKEQKLKLVGFKAHLKNAEIELGRCEIYFFRGGYGGLNLVEAGVANHCFLIRSEVVKEFNSDAQQIVERVIFQNKRAFETLKNAVPVYDWLAVAVDGFGLKNLNPAPNLISIGDAAAFIDPFTGSGMLMALESGEILTRAVTEHSSAEKIAESYRILHRQKFQKRLRVCSLLRRAAFAPHLAKIAISALSFGDLPRKILARATRPIILTSNE